MAETDPTTMRVLLAAQGYSELGLPACALAELEALPEAAQPLDAVVEMRLAIHMQARNWNEAIPCAEQLCQQRPQGASGFIHLAFCLHELGHTAQARECLLNGPESLHQEANFFYNLACYECVLGDLQRAAQHLAASISMDKKFRNYAKQDPDLRALHPKP